MKHSITSAGPLISAGLLLSLIFVVLYLLSPSFIRSLNYKVTDCIMTCSDKRPTSGSVVIIELDERSLAQYGQWPWPRYRLAHLLQKANDYGAKSIALDMILAEPDRTSPMKSLEAVQNNMGHRVKNRNSPVIYEDYDRYLAETLSQGPFVLGYEFLFSPPRSEKKNQLHPLKIIRVHENEPDKAEHFFEALGVVNNLEILSTAVSSSGFLNATPDQDGILRHMPLLIQYQGHFFPALSFAAFLKFKDLSTVKLRTDANNSSLVQVGEKNIPIDRQGNILLDFNTWVEKVPRISASDLLDDSVPKEVIAGKIALVGSSASGLKPVFQTPGNPVLSHVDIHAHMLETLLTGAFPVRDTRFLVWEGGFSFLLALIFSILITRTGVISSGMVGSIVILGLWVTARMIYQASGYLFSPLLPTLIVVSEYAVLTIVKTRKGQHHAEETADNALMLLKNSENNLNSIISSIPDIIFRLDPSGKVVFVSPAITQYKSPSDELLGQPIFDLVAPEDREKAAYRVNERRTGTRATHDLELRLLLIKKQSGRPEEQRHFKISAQGIYDNESSDNRIFVGTQGIVRDITEQKKLEERLLQAQKMEAVGNLAAGVAHDLNNILSGLVSYPDLLLLELPKDSPLRKKVTTIQQSGQRAAAIVQDMLTLARRGLTNREVFCPNRIVKEYFESPEFGKLKERHPKIEFDSILADDLLRVKGSPLHLSKALMNIATNAAEAMPAGGGIVVSSSNSYLDAAKQVYEVIPEGEYALLRVEDNGIGISADDLNKIFEPFYTKKRMGGSGTGLGMTVIWATIKDQGGYIDLKSKEGEGTRIDIYLPTTRESPEEQERRVVLEDYLGTEQILVVDDIQEQREIAVNMLSKLGYTVSSESSGEAAFSFIKENQVDLVVLDMIMPNGMDGLETYRKIITLFPGQKAVIASGFSESDRVKELQRLGAGAYIQKPYTLEKIGVAVRIELDRK